MFSAAAAGQACLELVLHWGGPDSRAQYWSPPLGTANHALGDLIVTAHWSCFLVSWTPQWLLPHKGMELPLVEGNPAAAQRILTSDKQGRTILWARTPGFTAKKQAKEEKLGCPRGV